MNNQNHIHYKGPGAFKIAAGVFMGLFIFSAFVVGLFTTLFMLGVLDVAGVI